MFPISLEESALLLALTVNSNKMGRVKLAILGASELLVIGNIQI